MIAAAALAAALCGGTAKADENERFSRDVASPGAAPASAYQPAPSAAGAEEALMLRMMATAETAVPIGNLDDALATNGGVAPDNASKPVMELPVEQVSTTSEPSQSAAPVLDTALAGAETGDTDGRQPGRILSSVKMRTKPDNAAAIVSVLAQNAAVTVFACDYWCEIDAAGKRGFVFKTFVAKQAPLGERSAEKQEP